MATFLGGSYCVKKDSKGFLFSGTVGALINIVLNFMLIPHIGIAGAALATCISYVLVYVYRCVDTRKYVKINVFNKQHIVSYIVMLAVAVLMFWDSIYGQMILFLGLFIELYIFKDIWMSLVRRTIKKIKR